MKVTGWTSWEDSRYKEFVGHTVAAEAEVEHIIAEELRRYGYKFSGNYHQNGEYGVPVLDNEYKYCVSQRRWGGIMVKAYPDEIDDKDGYGYVEWAWMSPRDDREVVPKKVVVY